MDQATRAADASVIDVRDLKERQTNLQTEYIKNENRVNDAKGKEIFTLQCSYRHVLKQHKLFNRYLVSMIIEIL